MRNQEISVLGMGFACIDMIDANGTFEYSPGGTAANVMCIIAQLGVDASLLMPMYNDRYTPYLLSEIGIAYTLTATDHHAVFSRQRVDEFKSDDVVSTQSARQHKDATDLVFEVYGQSQFGNYSPGCTTLRAQGGDNGGGSENLITVDVDEHDNIPCALLIRRLTPLECERLQGFPDTWTDTGSSADSGRYKALGNSVAIPCVEYIMEGFVEMGNEKS